MTKKNCTPIYSEGKRIGAVRGDTFYKTVSGKKHFLRKPPAIAISLDALTQAKTAGAVLVDVLDKETETHYQTSMEHIWKAGFTFDRGFGRQIGLALDGWAKRSPGSPVQRSLFK